MKKTFTFHRIYHNARNITGTEEELFLEKCIFLCKIVDFDQNFPRLQCY